MSDLVGTSHRPVFSSRGSNLTDDQNNSVQARLIKFLFLGTVKSAVNIIEPVHEKTNNLGFQPGLTQTKLYSNSKKLEAGNFGYK